MLQPGLEHPGLDGPGPNPGPPEPARVGHILILGGTRFLGPAVITAAQAAGHSVTIFHRGHSPFPELPDSVEELLGDREVDLAGLLGRRFTAVIDTSGQSCGQVRLCVALSCEQYLFVSTVSVYADPSEVGLHEDSRVRSSEDDYGGRKARCEEVIREAFGERATVVRPGVIAGPRDESDRFTYWALRSTRPGPVLCPGDGLDPTQCIDVRDVAEFLVDSVGRPGGCFNLVGAPQTMAEFLTGLGMEPEGMTWVAAEFLAEQEVRLPLWVDRHSSWRGFYQVDGRRAWARGLRLRPVADTTAAVRASHPGGELRAGPTPVQEQQLLRDWERRRGGLPS